MPVDVALWMIASERLQRDHKRMTEHACRSFNQSPSYVEAFAVASFSRSNCSHNTIGDGRTSRDYRSSNDSLNNNCSKNTRDAVTVMALLAAVRTRDKEQ